jgi:hypothetical protein
VLQCGIRAMSVLAGPTLGDYSCCMRMVLSYLRYLLCCSYLLVVVLGRSEMACGSGRNDAAIADALTVVAQGHGIGLYD